MEQFRTPSVGWVVCPTYVEREGRLWRGALRLYQHHSDFFCHLVGWLVENELQTLAVSALIPSSVDDEELIVRFADLVCTDYYLDRLTELYSPGVVEEMLECYNNDLTIFAEFVIWLAPRVAGIIEDYLPAWTINTQVKLVKLTPYGVSVSITLYA